MAATYMFAASERHNGDHSMPGILYTSDHNALITPLILPLPIHTHLASPVELHGVGYQLHGVSQNITRTILTGL